jgi:hypothetical protein
MMGRPKLQIDPKLVQDLAALGCKTTEIAVVVGCSTDTLEGRFSAELAKGRENLRISLRRWQLEAAKKGNVAMLIWLGKQMLGQTEKVEQTSSVTVKHLTPAQVTEILKGDPFLGATANEPFTPRIERLAATTAATAGDSSET